MLEDVELYRAFLGQNSGEFAEVTGISPGTWRSWRSRGVIPPERHGDVLAALPFASAEELAEWAAGIRAERERVAPHPVGGAT